MAEAVAEVSEAQADPAIKAIYEDIKNTLRLPSVPLTFRMLAAYPRYLQMAWRNLKPNGQIVYFEQSADELRALAVSQAATLGQVPSGPPQAQDAIRTAIYIAPKIFLAIAALRSATNGLQPVLMRLPEDAKRQIKPGIPSGAVPMTIETANTLPELQRIFMKLERAAGPAVMDIDGGGVDWSAFVEQSWTQLTPALQRRDFLQFHRAMRRLVEEAITALPFRMNIYPHALRHAGIPEHDIDAIRFLLNTQYDAMPSAVAHAAMMAASGLGKDAARSPFPYELL